MFKKLHVMIKKEKPSKEQLTDNEKRQGSALVKEMENGAAEPMENESPESNDVEAINRELEELKDKYMRLFAEFDNYKRRTVREKLDWMKTAAQDTMSALLPVLDDFDRARKFAEDKQEGGWSEGVELVYQKLFNTLRQKGLEAMESTGHEFDPEFHDAFMEIEAHRQEMKGKVVDTIEKGYKLNDKIIRHAKVVVGK